MADRAAARHPLSRGSLASGRYLVLGKAEPHDEVTGVFSVTLWDDRSGSVRIPTRWSASSSPTGCSP